MSTAEVVELTAEQSNEYFDQEARRLLGMSGREFVQRLKARELGELSKTHHTAVMQLEVLMTSFYSE